jgi:hypothetical protein
MPALRRFDLALMRPPEPQATADAALLQRVRTWCDAGARPRMTQAFSAAQIAPHTGLDGVACALDGSHELARRGRWRGLAWRLAILLRDRREAPEQAADDPWDCGWWREGAFDAAAAFRPRRATLLLVPSATPDAIATLGDILAHQHTHYTRPLRMLVITATAQPGVPQLD